MVLVIKVSDFKSDASNEEALSARPEQDDRLKYFHGVNNESLNALSTGDRVHTLAVSWKKDSLATRIGAWIEVHSVDGEWIEGKIVKDRDFGDDHDPALDKVIRVPKSRIWDISFEDPQRSELLREIPRRKYANYCLFDDNVGFDGLKVQYVYRVEPCLTKDGNEFPDSGWRIRGDRRVFSIELDGDTTRYTPLNCALYSDDSWIHLIDKPVGTAFKRDRKTGLFVEVKAPRSRLSPGEAELWRECMNSL
jgi:hypothetical protein